MTIFIDKVGKHDRVGWTFMVDNRMHPVVVVIFSSLFMVLLMGGVSTDGTGHAVIHPAAT